ncbi:nitrate reductase molybdenum cofactor assembly chaperone NarJ [mine drainage metagenome]|uniref:Nitrate reductase molybdenum cofactor assembly chaperone NarJ n=1 Tax=mine drainage metagenome TaxID=410659 RepID=A0A1J5PCB6_9ZZZZ
MNAFYLAVSLIIMGVGFLKPNISSVVGQLYPQGDPRRDSGFTLYYYGVNLGAFWASVLCAVLGQSLGWWAGFGLAGVGMAAGLIVFILGKPLLQGKGESPNPELLTRPLFGPINRERLIYLCGLLGVGGVWLLVPHKDIVGTALKLSSAASALFIVWILVFLCKTWVERQRMMLAVILVLGAVVFFTLFEQAGTSLNLFEQVHGDSRDRGQAMVDLLAQYQEAGLALQAQELPDYLPVYLEYCSVLDPGAARDALEEVALLVAHLAAALDRRESSWAAVAAAVCRLAGVDWRALIAQEARQEAQSPTPGPREGQREGLPADWTPAGLDAVWAEEPVDFLGACNPQHSTPSVQPVQFIARAAHSHPAGD